MQQSIRSIVIGFFVVLSFGYAGGKAVAPATAPVEPVAPVITPWPLYVGVGGVVAGVSRDCACADTERLKDLTYGGIVRAGWDFNPYLGIEARYLRSFLDKDFSTVEHYGIFLKPQYHITRQSNIYVLIGYGKTTATGCTSTGDLTKSGLSFGVGFEYDLGADAPKGIYTRAFDGQGDQEEGWGVWVDYQHLLYKEGVFRTNTNVVTAGMTYDF